jgi:hypothetical protein
MYLNSESLAVTRTGHIPTGRLRWTVTIPCQPGDRSALGPATWVLGRGPPASRSAAAAGRRPAVNDSEAAAPTGTSRTGRRGATDSEPGCKDDLEASATSASPPGRCNGAAVAGQEDSERARAPGPGPPGQQGRLGRWPGPGIAVRY